MGMVDAIRQAVDPFVSDEDATRYLDTLAREPTPKPPMTFTALESDRLLADLRPKLNFAHVLSQAVDLVG
jgi:hypothetical protein